MPGEALGVLGFVVLGVILSFMMFDLQNLGYKILYKLLNVWYNIYVLK